MGCRSLWNALVVALAALPSYGAAGDARRPKKLIATGWDQPDTERLVRHLAEMEKRPFDGVVVAAVGYADATRRVPLRAAFAKEPWQRDWFQPCLAHLKACKFSRFTDNFLILGANPGNVDWFDDAGWAHVAEHWRIAAWLAKQGGLRGLLFDPEPYTPPHNQFSYTAQPGRGGRSFDAYAAKARERGRQVMAAVAAEFPDAVLFCYFMNVVASTATGRANPNRLLASHGYGLLPAFVDGWLDAAPPTVTFVDGCEMAYLYNSVGQYLEAALLIKGACQELVSPENRAKYRAQVQAGFGLYLDAYWNPPTSPWHVDGLGGSRVDRLRANARTALRVADEYVWVYGEQFRWWPTPNQRVKEETWPEALPGCEAALRFARDPLDYARTQMAELQAAGKLANLARNADFAAERALSFEGAQVEWKEGRPPAGWSAWQHEGSKGTFTWDRGVGKGSARAAGVANGCFLQACAVRPGERYAVGALCRLQGQGEAWLRVRWQTAEGRWTAEALDVLIPCEAPRDRWGEMLGVVEVPEGVGRLLVLLGIADQAASDDVAWFDEVRVHRLE
ncbi:MAG TPA: hypothetical protein PLE19_04720 [Planctomycetota bacterium]|nr:hypothetical protein [Planctomycetota bacterium]HRR79091.1 hypothetical protein [Planctomycetota bacterium]HRT93176.1 hypothetical protein [Planctomycetota bacterium]